MAFFLRQQNLENCNGNDISQLVLFGDSAWIFISTMFESGWNRLLTSGNISFRDIISLQFVRTINTSPNTNPSNPNSHPVKRIPPSIPPCSSKEQLKKSKNYQTNCITKDTNRTNSMKSFAQVTALAVNIFKIKEAFPTLPVSC